MPLDLKRRRALEPVICRAFGDYEGVMMEEERFRRAGRLVLRLEFDFTNMVGDAEWLIDFDKFVKAAQEVLPSRSSRN